MSMGPSLKEEELSTGKFEKVQHSAKKISIAYFADPIHYLFYIALFILVLGLALGKSFSLEFYGILLILALVKLVRFYKPKTPSDEPPR